MRRLAGTCLLPCCRILTCDSRLRPHESYTTDVILLGHSMGGILGAEVAIMPALPPSSQNPFQHEIIGTINFDTPFLGMHPGIVFAGIGSLFRPAPELPKAKQAGIAENSGSQPLSPSSVAAQSPVSPLRRNQFAHSESFDRVASSSGNTSSTYLDSQQMPSPLASPINDSNYNPQYSNDAPVPSRQGWDKALHFWMKHAGNITTATKSYVTSHWEFSGALADYSGLRNRYTILRLLEDGKDINGKATRKVRFVNYYTASGGRPPKVRAIEPEQDTARDADIEEEGVTADSMSLENRSRSESRERQDPWTREQPPLEQLYPRSTREADQFTVYAAHLGNTESDNEDLYSDELSLEQATTMASIKPEIEAESEAESAGTTNSLPSPSTEMPTDISSSTSIPAKILSSLPALGPLPQPPADPDLDAIADKDERKLAVKEYSRQMQAYQRAMKDRGKAVRERQKLLGKREKAAEKDRLKQLKQEEREKSKVKKEPKSEANPSTKTPADQAAQPEPEESLAEVLQSGKEEKPAKDLKTAKMKKPTKETETGKEKPKKDKKFCMLPPKDSNGHDDKCWPRVFMEGVDEVGAHCGLFVADSPHYEAFVHSVGNRIKDWVVEANALHEERLLATQNFDTWREKR